MTVSQFPKRRHGRSYSYSRLISTANSLDTFPQRGRMIDSNPSSQAILLTKGSSAKVGCFLETPRLLSRIDFCGSLRFSFDLSLSSSHMLPQLCQPPSTQYPRKKRTCVTGDMTSKEFFPWVPIESAPTSKSKISSANNFLLLLRAVFHKTRWQFSSLRTFQPL